MKKQYLLILTIIMFLSACLPDGSDTIILPETGGAYLPEEIAAEWEIAIKCKSQSEIAMEVTLTTTNNSKDFTATGTGQDYDGQPINFTVTGTYDKKFSTLSAEIKYEFVNDGTFRIDYLGLDLGTYNHGSYIDLIKIDQTYTGGPIPSCDTEIKLFY